ncbi:MAG: 50S ribosomal protein L6 [Nanoarchaeota archaeon]
MSDKIIDELDIQQGITVSFTNNVFIIKGPKGEVQRPFYSTEIKTTVQNNKVRFEPTHKYTQDHKRMINTYKAHLKNNFKGVTQGHVYHLKICSGHFPMNVTMKGQTLEVKNLFGEAVPRTLIITEGVSAKVEGDKITVQGIDKEKTAQAAASIEQLTRRPGFDKRVFQDGIYLLDKDGKELL